MSAELPASGYRITKSREFRCTECRRRCTQSPTDSNISYGHDPKCPERPSHFPNDTQAARRRSA